MLLISLVLTLVMGYLLSASLLPSSHTGERVSLAFPFGMGMTTLMIFGLLSLGLAVSKGSLTLLQAVTATGLLLHVRRKGALKAGSESIVLGEFKFHFGWLILLFLFAAGLVFDIFYPITVSDGVGYKIIGKLMVGEQEILTRENWFPFENQNRTLGFHLISGYFYLFGFSHPKVVQSIYYISLIGFFHVSIRRFVSSTAATGFTLLLATSPRVFWHSFLYLNNLSAGFYFFCGTVYWFYSIHYNRRSYLLIASLAFMFAAWIRYESIIYFAIPLGLTCLLSIKNRDFKAPIYLLVFPLIFSGLWAFYSSIYYSFSPGLAQAFQYQVVFISLMAVGIVFALFGQTRIKAKTLIGIIVLFIVGASLALAFIDPIKPDIEVLYSVIISKLTWNVLTQVGWGLGISLALLIPIYYSFSSFSQKYLLAHLVFLYFGVALLMAAYNPDSTLLGSSIMAKVKYFFHNPGAIVNKSSPRQFFYFFPALLFLSGTMLSNDKIASGTARFFQRILFKHKVFNGLNIFILGNLIILIVFLLGPRMLFLVNHIGEPLEALRVTTGPKDSYNTYRITYQIAQAISRATPKNSIILMPYPYSAFISEKKPYDSLGVFQAYDVLYPRTLYWGSENRVPLNWSKIKGDNIYKVTYAKWDESSCKYHPQGKSAGYKDWFLCPASYAEK